MCCENITNEKYNDFKNKNSRNFLNITGPELIGDAIDIYKSNNKLKIGKNDDIKIFEFVNSLPYITDSKNKKIACNKYFKDDVLNTLYPTIKNDSDTFYNVLGGRERYDSAFQNKRVYKFNK